jgi:hypothetical protein
LSLSLGASWHGASLFVVDYHYHLEIPSCQPQAHIDTDSSNQYQCQYPVMLSCHLDIEYEYRYRWHDSLTYWHCMLTNVRLQYANPSNLLLVASLQGIDSLLSVLIVADCMVSRTMPIEHNGVSPCWD